jgi:hypothetical protein
LVEITLRRNDMDGRIVPLVEPAREHLLISDALRPLKNEKNAGPA